MKVNNNFLYFQRLHVDSIMFWFCYENFDIDKLLEIPEIDCILSCNQFLLNYICCLSNQNQLILKTVNLRGKTHHFGLQRVKRDNVPV